MISINNLSVSYGQLAVLKNFSLNLEQGGIYALIGPSGCGKSTLLKVLCGILEPSAGSIEYNGMPISEKKHAQYWLCAAKLWPAGLENRCAKHISAAENRA